MTVGNCCGTPTITPRLASAAMAMVTARTEENVQFVGFSHKLVPLGINGKMPLDAVIKTIEKVRFLLGKSSLRDLLSSYLGGLRTSAGRRVRGK